MPCTVLIVVAVVLTIVLSVFSLVAIKRRQARLVGVSKQAARELGLNWRMGAHGFEIEGDFRGAHVLITHVEETVNHSGDERVVNVPVLVAETSCGERALKQHFPEGAIVGGRLRVPIRHGLESVDDYDMLLARATGREG